MSSRHLFGAEPDREAQAHEVRERWIRLRRVDLEMRVLGRVRTYRGIVSEPDPGRVLAERYEGTDLATSFIVEPLGAAGSSRVTIMTDSQVHGGIWGRIEARVSDAMQRPVYTKELRDLAEYGAES